ncbi:hypothetical protein N9L47_11525 [Rhodobacteraceae bacterium]|nr:hypothetical protein [Paracoccaceae bacterium]
MKRTTLLTIAIIATAGAVSAKGHDQGRTDAPGTTVATTVGMAQTLGGSQGSRPADKGPRKSRGAANAGR